MVNRRFTQVATSDDEEEEMPPQQLKQRKRKRMKLLEEDYDDEEGDDYEDEKEKKKKKKTKKKKEEEEEEEEQEEPEPESPQPLEDAKPIGAPIRFSGKGRGRKKHYSSFEYDGNEYSLEDPVLLSPEDKEQKPYVAIIKDITQPYNGNIMVLGQWFYRPEEAEKKGGGSWKSRDTRELFYSFHTDEIPAESVMHKCIVHFIPLHKQIPKRKEHPGFIVQKVYDTVERKLYMLTDKDYDNQQEIDELVKKTVQRIGEPLDVEPEEAPDEQEDLMKSKRSSRRKSISPLDVVREEESIPKSDQHPKPETPGSGINNASEHYRILVNFNALIGDIQRDKWLERSLQNLQYMCHSDDSTERDKEGSGNINCDEIKNQNSNRSSEIANDCQDKGQKSSKHFKWPDAAVSAIVALEKASHDAFSSDFQKYNQKLRQLNFNLKNNAFLARRLLNRELEPSKILNMTYSELKEGLTAEEKAKKEPDESEHMQMTDARCSRCMDFKVGLREIIRAGHNDRYQLECVSCGNSWYASRDEISLLTIDAPDSKKSIGTAPWATAKFEVVQKKLLNPHESENPANDISGKPNESRIPVIDTQKPLGLPKKDENLETTKHEN